MLLKVLPFLLLTSIYFCIPCSPFFPPFFIFPSSLLRLSLLKPFLLNLNILLFYVVTVPCIIYFLFLLFLRSALISYFLSLLKFPSLLFSYNHLFFSPFFRSFLRPHYSFILLRYCVRYFNYLFFLFFLISSFIFIYFLLFCIFTHLLFVFLFLYHFFPLKMTNDASTRYYFVFRVFVVYFSLVSCCPFLFSTFCVLYLCFVPSLVTSSLYLGKRFLCDL